MGNDKFDVFYEYATSEVKEAGVEIKLGDGAYITVARDKNPRYTKKVQDNYLRHRFVLDAGGEPAIALDKLLMEQTIAETILVGFRGIYFKGELLEYSTSNALLLLSLPDFKKRVIAESERFENYRVDQEVADEKK